MQQPLVKTFTDTVPVDVEKGSQIEAMLYHCPGGKKEALQAQRWERNLLVTCHVPYATAGAPAIGHYAELRLTARLHKLNAASWR